MRVVRFYQSWIPPPLLSSPLPSWAGSFAVQLGQLALECHDLLKESVLRDDMTLRVVSFIAWRPHRALKAPALQTVCGFPGNGA